MYIPHYINAALPKTMSRTQQVRHTVKSFRIFSLLTTIAAVMCDWTQLNYYTQLSLNDTFWGGVSVSIIVVLGLDVSMFFLGTVLNQYRKATGTTKGNFRFIGIGLLVTFLIAYVVYLLMAIPVLSQQASDGDVPFYGRLLIPIASSALAFFTSVGWDPKGEQIQRLLDEKLKISSDIASVKNTIDKVNRDFAQLDIMEFENVEADRVYNLLMSKVNEATNEARIYLAEELGTSEAAKPDILELKQTAFYRYNYTNSGWSELKPADFLQQCRDDNIAWRRVQDLINPPKQRKNSSLQAKAASAELQEQSERMTNIVVYSSQLFEIRKILIDLYLQAKIRMANGDAEQTTYEEQYDRIDRAYGNKLLSLDHNTSFKKGSNGWKEFLQWDKEIKDSMVAKFVALYPYEELAVIQNSKNDGISRRQQLNNRVKYAEACLQDSKWLLRDDFLRLAFLDYLVTEPPENSDKEKKDSMEIIRDFANREGPILERCRLKPYDPDKDALTQDFVRTLENK